MLSQLGIHIILAKQEKIASNSLAKQLGINSNLANLPSARANIRARIRLGIRGSSFLSGALRSLSGPLRFVNGFFLFYQVKNAKLLEMDCFFTWHIILGVDKSQDLSSKIWQTLGDALIVDPL